MSDTEGKVRDHTTLFQEPEYEAMLENKRVNYECGHPDDMVRDIADWTKSWDYREKNLARKSLSVNPAKACQPLGAVFAAAGYQGAMSFVHGSQGCVAYYRSHLSRHFKEPVSAVSSSMTEDAAVFGGLNNLVEGLANTKALYDPEMIAVSTTCMAEVIGDDLNSFIEQARTKAGLDPNMAVPFAHTPAFNGSHVDGYDNMQKGILQHFWEELEREPNAGFNIIPGFDGYAVANIRELRRMMGLMGIEATILSDVSDVYDTPSDGEFRMYAGGTTRDEVKGALNAAATLSLQDYCSRKTLEFCQARGQETRALHYPMGVAATDELVMTLAELGGVEVPESLKLERGRLVDAMADSQSWLHGKSYAIYGDPDFVYAMARFVMETGGEPRHCVATNGTKAWGKKMQALLDGSPFGQGCKAWPGKDLWAMRSLLATEPTDLLIGNSHGKYLERDTGVPLVRLTFPIFDRHHHHRFPTWGYQGALNVLVKILDKIFDRLDEATGANGEADISFDLTR